MLMSVSQNPSLVYYIPFIRIWLAVVADAPVAMLPKLDTPP